ncbi:unnamed protein product [Paramecium pentaurelia]|uniref:Uncharacterized protein n=1 Tax=Paramecium pentaurelia TaxID=43138 RepID=A0A8S1YEQ3_9CILI|nr:unnamed protein product [Paramecium pentaurelia]
MDVVQMKKTSIQKDLMIVNQDQHNKNILNYQELMINKLKSFALNLYIKLEFYLNQKYFILDTADIMGDDIQFLIFSQYLLLEFQNIYYMPLIVKLKYSIIISLKIMSSFNNYSENYLNYLLHKHLYNLLAVNMKKIQKKQGLQQKNNNYLNFLKIIQNKQIQKFNQYKKL